MSASISLTELRQRLFELADRVVESGEPLLIVRNGVRLRLVREETVAIEKKGRLARLVERDIVVGPPLDPHESPAEWSGELLRVAEPEATYGSKKPRRKTRK
ncbi:MAG TPA: type II toxin-antitoxin system prevent-host-death family antitoxin [Rhodanobacteraceae bacterium]|jgi:antitoxin (DNA-binding transcriptional repressor) of toxin-antitoxin stability system|nr:type II toxin-antitoxin system prevent-host-death family antitoxin [Rhodanobacteraceae bacterium]